MGRLVDIKELSFGITPVSDYVISRAKESAGEDFSLTLPSVEAGYPPGSDITIRGINGFVTTREYNSGPEGYQTVIGGVSKVVDVIRKAPSKSLMYMSMTPNELEEFQIANSGSNMVVDYSYLDYIPLIKVCNERTLAGGWSSSDVIIDLVARMGLQLICNVRSYWLRQVSADIQSSYFDTIVSVVNFLKPTIYIDEGVLYIFNQPYRNGSVSFDKISHASQKETFNYDSKVTYIKVMGGLGEWDRSKYKGRVEAEKSVIVRNTIGSESGMQMYLRMNGDMSAVNRFLGTRLSGTGEYNVQLPMGQPMSDYTTTEENWRLDPFGNNKALLSRHVTTQNRLLSVSGLPDVTTYDSMETYTYEFLDEQFDKPRMTKRVTETGRYTWMLVYAPGFTPSRYYKQKVDKIEETWVYAPNGNLIAETMSRESDCFRQTSYGKETYYELDLGDWWWMQEGDAPGGPYMARAVVEERYVFYRQITNDLYQKVTYHRTLGGLLRQLGDGKHTSTVDNIKGRVPKHPKPYRKLQVYAEEKPSSQGSMDVAALVVSNPNICTWADAAALLTEVKRNAVSYQYTIERQLMLPKDVDVDIGWRAEFGTLPAGRGEQIPAVTVRDGMIASWTRSKDAKSGQMQTVITLQGKVE